MQKFFKQNKFVESFGDFNNLSYSANMQEN